MLTNQDADLHLHLTFQHYHLYKESIQMTGRVEFHLAVRTERYVYFAKLLVMQIYRLCMHLHFSDITKSQKHWYMWCQVVLH